MSAAKPLVALESDLPEAWEPASVGDVFEVKYGKGLKEANRVGGDVPVYGSNGVVGRHNTALTIGPTIILGRKGSIGAVHFSPSACWPIDTTYFIDDFQGLESEFVAYALRSLGLSELDTSTAIPGLNRDDLYSQVFPLPPLAEQKRIVEKIKQLLARVNAARERLARVPVILKRFRQAVLAASCSGRLTAGWREQHLEVESASELLLKIVKIRAERTERGTEKRRVRGPKDERDDEQSENVLGEVPESWAWCRVEQIATVCLGGTPPRKKQSYWNGDIAWVSSGEVANCRISATEERITREGLDNSNAKVYPKKTVLIAMIGEGKTRGQSAILDMEASTNQNVAGLVFDADSISPEYVWFWGMSEYERNRAVGRGGAQPALNGEKVRNLKLPLPPLEEQREIVRRVEVLFKLADAIEKRVAAATAPAEKLTQAILTKAFRGELVPTEAELARREGRSYEPASALLARIRTAQEGRPALGRHAARHRSAPR